MVDMERCFVITTINEIMQVYGPFSILHNRGHRCFTNILVICALPSIIRDHVWVLLHLSYFWRSHALWWIKELVFCPFLHIGWRYFIKIWYASLSWIVKDQNLVLFGLNYFPLNYSAVTRLCIACNTLKMRVCMNCAFSRN
jgi:hypothetical protein